MLTAVASVAGSAPHERLEALHRTREEELAKAHEHVRATQWAFAHASMVAAYDEWEQDGDDDDGDWEDWGEDSPAASEPGTPDWRGVSASVCSVNPPRVPVVFFASVRTLTPRPDLPVAARRPIRQDSR